MTFDKKAWSEKNRDKQKLYSLRYRLRKKGLDLPAEILEQREAIRLAKKEARKENEKESKRRWAALNKERRNKRYRERYANDPEFRQKEIDRRLKLLNNNKKIITEEEREARLRRKREAAAKACRVARAKAVAKAAEKAATQALKKDPVKSPATSQKKKPGRLLMISGWRGF